MLIVTQFGDLQIAKFASQVAKFMSQFAKFVAAKLFHKLPIFITGCQIASQATNWIAQTCKL
jgi:hypothetical protein